MKLFWKFFDKLIEVMAAIAGGILVFIAAAVCYTIGMRFFFTQTTIWIMQTTEYALLWIVFLATTWLLREGGHITTDIIYTHLNNKTKQYLDCIMFVIGGFACAIMVFFGILYMYECIVGRVTDVRAVTVPKSAVFIIIPIGSILLTMQFFRMAWSRFSDIRAGK
ncbi:MAG: TRAP transporter small permease [Proteobacteria bacterium]|jgi:TRAP-type C4-dicarboxylate transport system permease small subunit|nr:TRAP transporter small permease [Pseudomonadota bacterium]